jgi:uncharacterized protein DUF4430
VRRLSVLLILIPLLLLSSCSDDDGDERGGAISPPAATQATGSQSTGAEPAVTQAAPTDAAVQGTITVDFTGAPEELERIDAAFEVSPGATAWDAIKTALGEENVSTQEFSGLGLFITGFNGVEVEGNHFWEFKVNGEGSEVGVSQYEVKQGDVIEFVYSSF